MNRNNKLFLIGGIITLVAVFFFSSQWFVSTKGKDLSDEEAKELIAKMYPGEILSLERVNNEIVADVERSTGVYRVLLDEKNGEVQSVEKIKEPEKKIEEEATVSREEAEKIIHEQLPGEIQSIEQTEEGHYQAIVKGETQLHTIVVEGGTGNVLDKKTEPIREPSKRITQQEAVQIALSHVSGEIDDIETENINGALHYFIEIETAEDDATVEINSITGEVRSVTWDD